jgi:hypothetical protein
MKSVLDQNTLVEISTHTLHRSWGFKKQQDQKKKKSHEIKTM